MKNEYAANDIALWFVYKTNAEMREHISDDDDFETYEGITHLKLQKLLYFATGISLAILKEPLFKENILAWRHGPVVPQVYDLYKKNGKDIITIKEDENNNDIIKLIESDSEISTLLNMVYDNFAIYTAWQLREMTHENGTPWEITVKTKGLDAVIENCLIQEYFEKEIVIEGSDER